MKCSRRALAAVVWLAACSNEAVWDDSIAWPLPASIDGRMPAPERNPTTMAGVALGRRLFFDPRLSGSNRIACASCHDPATAFADARERSLGASGRPSLRNAPTLVDVAWMTGLFWDGGAKELESQAFAPLTSADEMAQDLDELLEELAADPAYVDAFDLAFPDGLTLPNVVRALAQFERTLTAGESRFDRFVRGEIGARLDAQERHGWQLVQRHCASCHASERYTDHGYHNNGLDRTFPESDERIAWGRGRISRDPADIGKFKTPTLRNVAVTGPYMHDGRFATLEQVVEHYRAGVVPSPTLADSLRMDGERLGIVLRDDEAAAIVAFLYTLTDAWYLD